MANHEFAAADLIDTIRPSWASRRRRSGPAASTAVVNRSKGLNHRPSGTDRLAARRPTAELGRGRFALRAKVFKAETNTELCASKGVPPGEQRAAST